MTLKHYLFMLIALLVLVLGGLQLVFISYLQQQVEQEVAVRSEALSNMAVNVLQENFNQQIREKVVVSSQQETAALDEISQSHKKLVIAPPSDADVQMVIIDTREDSHTEVSETTHQQFRIELGDKSPEEILKLETQLKALREHHLPNQFVTPDIKIRRTGDVYQFDIGPEGDEVINRQVVKFAHRESTTHQYFNLLMYVTLVLTALGLLCAFWLAHKISKPFLRLNNGFSALGKGDFGNQVKVEGIEDIRLTLQQFNETSRQLKKLHDMEQRVQQQEQLVEIGEVSRGLAHTLRNPLNTIGLAVEQLCQSSLSKEQKQNIEHQVRQKIQHLDKTIKAMMNLTSQDIDRSHPVNINQLIQDIVMELRFSSTVTIELQTKQQCMLNGSESEFRTILHSLLSNAVEASDPKDVVTVTMAQTEKQLTIEVTDQGHGLGDTIRENLFKPHVSDKAEGAGMGLFIAQRICGSRYQGEIMLEDNQPKGCVATVTFPFNRERPFNRETHSLKENVEKAQNRTAK